MSHTATALSAQRCVRVANAHLDTTVPAADAESRRLKHEEIARRYERKEERPFWTWQSWLTRRLNEIEFVLWDRYRTGVLPDGHDGDLRIVLHHMAKSPRHGAKMRAWIKGHAPWLPEDEGDLLICRAIASKKLPPRADTLARYLNLTNAVRERLGIVTIGAVDRTKRQRTMDRKQRKHIAGTASRRAKRRAEGAMPRAEYEASSLSRTKPWAAEGISRSTWERRRRKAADASVSDSNTPQVYRRRRTCVTVPAGQCHDQDEGLQVALSYWPVS